LCNACEMTDPWPRSETIRAARDQWLKPDVPMDGHRGVSVSEVDDGLLLTFQWRRDPNTYALRLPWPGTPEDEGQGIEAYSAENRAFEKTHWLAEEIFATNFTRRARRIKRNGLIHLEPQPVTSGRRYDDYYITDVPLRAGLPTSELMSGNAVGHVVPAHIIPSGFQHSSFEFHLPGSWLAGFSLDVSVPRQMLEDRLLITWLQAMDSATGIRVVGHSSLSWHPELPATALIDVVQVLADIPDSVSKDLILSAFCSTREAGVLRVVTALADPVFLELGFHPSPAGGLVRETQD